MNPFNPYFSLKLMHNTWHLEKLWQSRAKRQHPQQSCKDSLLYYITKNMLLMKMAWPLDQPNKLLKFPIQLLGDFTSYNTVWEIDEERGGGNLRTEYYIYCQQFIPFMILEIQSKFLK